LAWAWLSLIRASRLRAVTGSALHGGTAQHSTVPAQQSIGKAAKHKAAEVSRAWGGLWVTGSGQAREECMPVANSCVNGTTAAAAAQP